MSLRRKSLVLLLSISAVVAAAKDPPKFDPGPASSFPSKQTLDKLTVGAAPYDTEELARTAFGKVNPHAHGILPVLVVMQNDGTQTLQLADMVVRYGTPDGRQVEATPARDLPYLAGAPRPSASPGPAPPYPWPRTGGRRKNPLSAIEIESRAFVAKMLPPGQSAFGFFYFQTSYRDTSQVYITGIRQAATGKELFYIEIPLAKSR
jgi:hypothetical protein